MKNLLCTVVASVIMMTATAQQSKMDVFAAWHGHWKGEGWIQAGPEKKASAVTEYIEPKLEGTILTLEGIGKSVDLQTKKEITVHHAFGIISFDSNTGDYKLRSYLADGRSTDAWLKVIDANTFRWGFEVANRKIRYSILLDPVDGTWHETGEYNTGDDTWQQFFEMNLSKIK